MTTYQADVSIVPLRQRMQEAMVKCGLGPIRSTIMFDMFGMVP